MAYQNSSVQAYRQTRVKPASPGRLVVMLYDEALRQIDLALASLDNGPADYDTVNRAILKAQDVMTELTVSLDLDQGGDIAQNLFRLYLFFSDRLVSANIQKDAAPLKEIRAMIENLHDAWQQIASEASARQSPVNGVNIAG